MHAMDTAAAPVRRDLDEPHLRSVAPLEGDVGGIATDVGNEAANHVVHLGFEGRRIGAMANIVAQRARTPWRHSSVRDIVMS